MSDAGVAFLWIFLVLLILGAAAFELWMLFNRPDIYFRMKEDRRQARRAWLDAELAKKKARREGWASFGGMLLRALFGGR